jgi:hypothetical protein
LGIGHREYDRYVVDLLRAWSPPFDSQQVCEEIAVICGHYRITSVVGDKYGGIWVPSAFEKAGLHYQSSALPKSDLYLAFEAHVNTRKVELLDNPKLIAELRSLERRRGRSGKDVVDHPPRLHDDCANSIAGLCHLLRDAVTTPGRVDVQMSQSLRWTGAADARTALEVLGYDPDSPGAGGGDWPGADGGHGGGDW